MLPLRTRFPLELGVQNPTQEIPLFVHHLSAVFSPTLVHPPKRAFSNHLQHVVLFHDRSFRIPQKEEGREELQLQGQFHTSGKSASGMKERVMLAALPFPLFHNNPRLKTMVGWSAWENDILEQIMCFL